MDPFFGSMAPRPNGDRLAFAVFCRWCLSFATPLGKDNFPVDLVVVLGFIFFVTHSQHVCFDPSSSFEIHKGGKRFIIILFWKFPGKAIGGYRGKLEDSQKTTAPHSCVANAKP